ncbi:sigma-54 dependent transcriptional regulator [Devosia sp. J2-20]|jgi:two-component system C4-dicarboxylate transport response regulator DctD|uniref:sigma-54-dependent transcriptional regulator n=1 Tax=Devosia TaxID=46913 RepID=UPI0022B002C7|nr:MULTISPECIES: sigma-54 dependent transcriptional regulator [Devosia]MCZ4346184.1 sigma-54 dependent transcriptional regulator [Devosia neptuniae]WDQ98081.1 sigma-54 dependent transcriptional regulator [Devosia sp. J2-20]|tara:strand:- start:2797 stop:4140 length:1344 start_codon:yes stop_codon:yes gene_type:complete
MSLPIEVLLVDDEEDLRRATSQTLDLVGFPVRTTASAEEALASVSRGWHGILVTDIRMPGMDGMTLLRKAVAIDPDLPVLLLTGHGDVNLAVDAMRDGAYDFIEKPFSVERLLDSITRAMEKRQLTLENRALRSSVANRSDDLETRLVGRTPVMVAVRKQIRAVAPTRADVLIVGDTGTGKELAARAIHDLSSEEDRPFVAINCAAIPAEMMEAELFGYEVGAFAGAMRARVGKFEHARNGTIFLDDIENMPLYLQAKLLRVVQERAVTRLGSHEPIALNARFIATSSVDLERAANEESFRKDLLYRLNIATLRLPPLADRAEDIPALFAHLVQIVATQLRVAAPSLSTSYLSSLSLRPWPGNVRELRNAAERYVLGIDGVEEARAATSATTLRERVQAFERQAIADELRAQNGSLKAVYEVLGLSRKSLYEKMVKLGLDRKDFRED